MTLLHVQQRLQIITKTLQDLQVQNSNIAARESCEPRREWSRGRAGAYQFASEMVGELAGELTNELLAENQGVGK